MPNYRARANDGALPGTPVQEIIMGPFAGGINRYSDPTMIADNELVDCVNFDIALDGALTSRPPWNLMYGSRTTSTSSSSTPPGNYQVVIGTGVFENARYVIISSTHSGAAASYIYFVDGTNAGVLAKIADGAHSKAHRYDNNLYLVPDTINPGVGAQYDLNAGLVTLLPDMPSGYSSCIYKDRLFISGRQNIIWPSRLFFSDLANFGSYPGTNFFDINPGDGDSLQDIVVYQDNIVIFKDNATYVLSYDTGPAQAVLQVINTTVGASGRNCVGVYENSIFVLKYNQVYEMSNYDFVKVSVKIPFEYDTTLPPVAPYAVDGQGWKYPLWLRIVGDRALVRFYNRLYVYHLRLRSWTTWSSDDPNIAYIGPPMRLDNTETGVLRGYETYVACSTVAKVFDAAGPGISGDWRMYFKLFQMKDIYDDTSLEMGNIDTGYPDDDPIKLRILTKQIHVGLSHRFKRLMHWGVDCYTGKSVTGTLYPFSVAYKVSWNQLSAVNWHNLKTWEYPLTEIRNVIQVIPADSGVQVKYIKFPLSLRFRLLQFKVDMETAGNTTDGPGRIYTINAFVAAKQIVPKAVN